MMLLFAYRAEYHAWNNNDPKVEQFVFMVLIVTDR